MIISRVSRYSGIRSIMDIPCTQEQYDKWVAGMHIQDAMPNVSEDDREFILTGMTKEEWDECFADAIDASRRENKPTAYCYRCNRKQPHHGDPDSIHLHLCNVCNCVVEY